jgi:hypothetical protein
MLLVIDGLHWIAIRPGVLRDMPHTSMGGHGNAREHQKEGPKETLGWPTTKIILKTWRRTMKTNLEKRLQSLESALGPLCPRCRASKAMSEEELDERIQALLSGQAAPELPDPSPSCPDCQKLAAMSEAEIDAKLARLLDILREAI